MSATKTSVKNLLNYFETEKKKIFKAGYLKTSFQCSRALIAFKDKCVKCLR